MYDTLHGKRGNQGRFQKYPHIPEAAVARLSVYSRYLAQLASGGIHTVSSDEIARAVGVTAATVRKDLSFFGDFGTRGVGYRVAELHERLLEILGLTAPQPVVIVGAGKLGSALATYHGFPERGFPIKALFDVDSAKVGRRLGGIEVYHLSRLPEIASATGAVIGLICVPFDQAQEVANALVAAGVKGIINFSPRPVTAPPGVEVRQVDLSVNLDLLSFQLTRRRVGLAAAHSGFFSGQEEGAATGAAR